MSAITFPRGNITPIGHVEINGVSLPVFIDKEWDIAITQQLLNRVGGVSSDGVTDAQISAFEDAGIAEQQAQIYALDRRLSQEPVHQEHAVIERLETLIAELQAQLTVLQSVVNGIMEGNQQ